MTDGDATRQQRQLVHRVHAFAAERFDDLRALEASQFWAAVDGNDGAFPMIREVAAAKPDDRVLDVGCGAGLLACQLARYAGHVTGIDLVPEMLVAAADLQDRAGISNVTWQLADIPPIPFPDETFTLVITRLCLHHTPDPAAITREMARVCTAEGRVVIVDEVAPSDVSAAVRYNAWERSRDPSHERFLAAGEHLRHLREAGLVVAEPQIFLRELDLDVVLENSYPRPDHVAAMAALKSRAIEDGSLFQLRKASTRWIFNTVDLVVEARKVVK